MIKQFELLLQAYIKICTHSKPSTRRAVEIAERFDVIYFVMLLLGMIMMVRSAEKVEESVVS